MKFKTFLLIGITVGLVAGLVQYKQTLKTDSSASESSPRTAIYIDSQSCHASPGARWTEAGYGEKYKPGPYPFPTLLYHRYDRLVQVYLEPIPAKGLTRYMLIDLHSPGENPKENVTTKEPYSPMGTEIKTRCGSEISTLYVYRCLGLYCSPPEGKGYTTDDQRDYRAMMEDFVLVKKYLRTPGYHDASWAQTSGKYLMTPWCDPQYFDCSRP